MSQFAFVAVRCGRVRCSRVVSGVPLPEQGRRGCCEAEEQLGVSFWCILRCNRSDFGGYNVEVAAGFGVWFLMFFEKRSYFAGARKMLAVEVGLKDVTFLESQCVELAEVGASLRRKLGNF